MARRAGTPRLKPDRKGSGVWYIYYRDGGKPREHSTGARGRAEAEAYFAAWLQQRAVRDTPAGPRHPAQMTIGEALTLYADGRGAQIADRARLGYDIAALAPWWGELAVADITPERALAYVAWRKERIVARRAQLAEEAAARLRRKPEPVSAQVSNSTPRRELATLNAAVAWCVRNAKLTYGPAAPLPAPARPKERVLSVEEVARLIRAGRTNTRLRHVADWIRVAFRTGARKSAILALRTVQNMDGGWADIENGVIDLLPLSQAQTNKRRPRLPAPDGLLCWMRAKMRRSKTDYVIAEYGRKPRRGGLAPAVRPVADIKKGFAELCRLAGVEGATPHTLRHAAVTHMCRRGVPFWQIAGYTGMSEAMIRRVYGHHHPEYLAAAKAAMSGGRRLPTNSQRMAVGRPREAS